MEEIEMVLDMAKEGMNGAIEHLKKGLGKIRAGRAHASMLDGIYVDYYGTSTPLSQVSNINTPDGRTMSIQPWEKPMLEPIERAIMMANIGLNPQNNGELIMINIPALTEERRKALVKQARAEGEHAKVSIRNARKEANDEIKSLKEETISDDLAKDAEDQIQKLTDGYVTKIDEFMVIKEKDIMTV
ncbi:MAG: ribosome recycling factor [Flavobacteriales bacterium]|jgi:ribosome recycling factor|nr:ribosome recycling factor [Flavobacteriales bacterium]